MNFNPTDDRLLVLPDEVDRVTKGGILLPLTDAKNNKGIVVKKGPGKQLPNGTRVPIDIEVGDHVLFGRYSGTIMTVDEKEHILLKEGDIFGILKD